MGKSKEITRRTFMQKGKKLAYMTPVILTVLAGSEEAMAKRGRSKKKHKIHGGVSPAGDGLKKHKQKRSKPHRKAITN